MTTPARNSGPSGNNGSVLWMGDVDPLMDEDSVRKSFADMNEPVDYVRVMRPKEGSSFGTSGYAFVGFSDEATAQRVLSSLNGKPIPNAEGKRFKLNSSVRSHCGYYQNRPNSGTGQSTRTAGPRISPSANWARTGPRRPEFTAYIGDMTTDMDDESFFDLFHSSYPSVFAARIMRTQEGTSKQFAFVRFSDEAEYREALSHEQQISHFLRCKIRICRAHPRPPAPRRWYPAHNRLFPSDPVPQLIDPSGAKFQNSSPGLSVESQHMRQNSPSGQQQQQPQPLPQALAAQHVPTSAHPYGQPDQMQAVYYIPMPGYPAYQATDPSYWHNQWHELYSVPDGGPGAQPAYAPALGVQSGVPEAGDTAHMHAYASYTRPVWQMPAAMHQAHHFLQDPRLFYCAADVPDSSDTGKDPSSAKADVSQGNSN